MKKILSILLLSMGVCLGQLQTNKVNNTAAIYNTNSVNVYNWKNIYTGSTFRGITNFLNIEVPGTIQSYQNGTNLYYKGSIAAANTYANLAGTSAPDFPPLSGFTIINNTNFANPQSLGRYQWNSSAITVQSGVAAYMEGYLVGTNAVGRPGTGIKWSVRSDTGSALAPVDRMFLEAQVLRGIGLTISNMSAKLLTLDMFAAANAGGFNITNVLAAVNPLDAVNLAQLQAATGGVFMTGVAFTGSNNIFTAVNTFQGVTTNAGRLVATDGVLFTGAVTNGSLVVTNTVLAVGNFTGTGSLNVFSNSVAGASSTNDIRGTLLVGTNALQQSMLGANGFAYFGISNTAVVHQTNYPVTIRANSIANEALRLISPNGLYTNDITLSGVTAVTTMGVGASYIHNRGFYSALSAGNFISYALSSSGVQINSGIGASDNIQTLGIFASGTGALKSSLASFQTNGFIVLGSTNNVFNGMSANRVADQFYGFWSTNVTINPGLLIAGATADTVIGFTGAASNDPVILGLPAAIEPGIYGLGISSNGNVIVRVGNGSVGTITPASATWKVVLWRH